MTPFVKKPEDFPLLKRLLKDKSEDFQQRVWDYVALTDLQPDDPGIIFPILLGQLQLLLSETPDTLERMFKEGSAELKQSLELSERVLIARQKKAIADAALAVIREAREEAKKKESLQPWSTIALASGCLAGILGLGFFLGMTISPFLQGGYVENMRITAERAATLRWAESKSGRKAREILELNSQYLNSCERDVRRLGLTLTFNGVTKKSGFCLLWIKKPN
ncbi:hypothetical protein H6S82_00025 [Planktothrix sp. FACHB-1355]|uniref:Uncharacterized protein n=1 Tax=Aerosakkonema funiforme FACHB-1375 TaxID=2949571 RepID=A0A926ZGR3_9CYAN|nr:MULTISPECIES: DUF6753 family protein [Oscillatoriales]MBD2181839.1 hypothetical protein [Aerosakkonema funiforme FACHB-1375]MBD3557259.1 hypothetical protein [Planktothrix sp. FACHB-1355]